MRWDDYYVPFRPDYYEEGDPRKYMYPWMLQTLYYKDKRTGEVKQGVVIKPGNFKFRFWFEGGQVRLDKEVIGKRLFETEADARNYGKMDAELKEGEKTNGWLCDQVLPQRRKA